MLLSFLFYSNLRFDYVKNSFVLFYFYNFYCYLIFGFYSDLRFDYVKILFLLFYF